MTTYQNEMALAPNFDWTDQHIMESIKFHLCLIL